MTAPAYNSPYPIITDAYLDAGLIQRGEEPDSGQLATGMRRLQDLINIEQTQGLKLFLQEDLSVTLVAGTRDYVLTVASVKPLRVLQGYYQDNNTPANRRPIYPLSWQEWLTLSQVSTAAAARGSVTQYFINKQSTTLTVSFWLTPDTTAALGTAHLMTQRQVTNPIMLNEAMEFPIEWRMFLHWGLAAELATGQPQAVIDRCEGKATTYRAVLEDWDVEDAETSFQPDSRYGGGQSSFR